MMQTFDIEHNRLFNELTATLKEDIVKIAGKCNGGKSILFVYPPRDEDAYVAKAREELTDGYSFIDVRESFRLFLDEAGIDTFESNYKDFARKYSSVRILKKVLSFTHSLSRLSRCLLKEKCRYLYIRVLFMA